MLSFRTVVRRAPALALVALLLTTALGGSVPARAQSTQEDQTPPAPVVRDHRGGQGPVLREPRTNNDPNAAPALVRDHRAGDPAGIQLQAADDPAARVQILLKSIHVANDRDGWARGAGDFTLTVSFFQCAGPQPPCGSGDGGTRLVAEWKRDFSADSGDVKTLDRLMPITADVKEPSLASEDGALALYEGRSYMFQVSMFERDTHVGDHMGGIQRILEKSNYWGIGTYEREAAGELKEKIFGRDDQCAGCGGIIVGDYLVTYQILDPGLPDLKPTAIRTLGDAGDGLEEVCLAVVNQGTWTSGPFNMALFIDQAPAVNGSVNVVGLDANAPHESCFRTTLPSSGIHALDLIVDQPRAVPELNERNNQLQQSLDRGAAPPTPTPDPDPTDGATSPKPNGSPTPGPILIQAPNQGKEQGQPQADLTVSAVKVRGQVPDGKDDCKEGGNEVAVVVKNAGKGDAGSFAVRLAVDGGEAVEESVKGLEAGKEREVRFGDVKLKKGAHKLVATLDPDGAVAEANEDDNARTVTASCRDDS